MLNLSPNELKAIRKIRGIINISEDRLLSAFKASESAKRVE